MCIYIYYRQTCQSSFINQKATDKISGNLEEKIILESDNIVQSESQIIEDEDFTTLFDAPQKESINKSNQIREAESNNCSKIEEVSNSKDSNIKKAVKSNNIEQNASQIIEDESSPTMDLSECVGDVSCLFLLSYL